MLLGVNGMHTFLTNDKYYKNINIHLLNLCSKLYTDSYNHNKTVTDLWASETV